MSDTIEPILTDEQRAWWPKLVELWDVPNLNAIANRLAWLEAERERLIKLYEKMRYEWYVEKNGEYDNKEATR